MTLEALLARLRGAGTPGTPGNDPGVPPSLGAKLVTQKEKLPSGTPGTPGTPKNDKGGGDGASDEHEAATLDDEGEGGAAEGNDRFEGVPVFQVFQQENKPPTSSTCRTNRLEHLPRKPVFQVFQTADEGRFNERAAVLEFDHGLPWAEAERQAAAEQGFATPDELFAALAAGWADHLLKLQASERSRRGQECITAALAFIADGWAVNALACGWSELELVRACPVAPWERLDRLGGAYSTFTPTAVTPEAILYHSSGCTKWTPKGVKEPLRLLRSAQADGAVLPWERPARDEPPPFAMPDKLDNLSEAELYALARGARFICELERVWREIDARKAAWQAPNHDA